MSEHLTPRNNGEKGEKNNPEIPTTDTKKATNGIAAGLAAARTLGSGLVFGIGKKIGEFLMEDLFHDS